MSNITKTIKESLENAPRGVALYLSNGDLEQVVSFDESQSHLLQSQIRLIDVQIANLKKEYKKAFEAYQFSEATREFFRGKLDALEDQISSLEEVKKLIENL
jgi:hypothetical protein